MIDKINRPWVNRLLNPNQITKEPIYKRQAILMYPKCHVSQNTEVGLCTMNKQRRKFHVTADQKVRELEMRKVRDHNPWLFISWRRPPKMASKTKQPARPPVNWPTWPRRSPAIISHPFVGRRTHALPFERETDRVFTFTIYKKVGRKCSRRPRLALWEWDRRQASGSDSARLTPGSGRRECPHLRPH